MSIVSVLVLLVTAGSLSASLKHILGTKSRHALFSIYGYTLTPHRLVHVTTFGILALAIVLLARGAAERLFSVAAVIAFGIFLEALQYAIAPWPRPFEIWDVRDDVYGAFGGYLLAACLILCTKVTWVRNKRVADQEEHDSDPFVIAH